MYAIIQPCGTTIIANLLKTIYHALTCVYAFVARMKVKVKIVNLTKKILIQFRQGRLPVKFICFFVLKIVLLLLHVNQVSAFLVEIKTTWIKQLVTFPKIPFLVSLPLIGISYYSCLNIY